MLLLLFFPQGCVDCPEGFGHSMLQRWHLSCLYCFYVQTAKLDNQLAAVMCKFKWSELSLGILSSSSPLLGKAVLSRGGLLRHLGRIHNESSLQVDIKATITPKSPTWRFMAKGYKQYPPPASIIISDLQIGVRGRLRVRVSSSEHPHFENFRPPNLKRVLSTEN